MESITAESIENAQIKVRAMLHNKQSLAEIEAYLQEQVS